MTTFEKVTMTDGDGVHDVTDWFNAKAAERAAVTLRPDCRSFAAAWLNVSLAASDNEEQPVLYRTVFVEVYDGDRLRLVATNSYMLLTATVGDDPPEMEEAPVASYIVMDPDKRGQALLKWAHKLAARADKDGNIPPSLRLSVEAADPDGPPTLSAELTRRAFTITLDENEAVSLDIFESPYPSWRPLLLDREADPVSEVAYNAEFLALLGKIRDAEHTVIFTPSGDKGLTLLRIGSQYDDAPHLDGGLMPIRLAKEDR